MPEALVALGSNVDASRNLPTAVSRLAGLVEIRRVSSAWATPAVGPPGQPPFLNAAALIATDLAPARLKAEVLREIERAMGRRRTADRFAPRSIDIDLVLWGRSLDEAADGDAETALVLDPDLQREPHLAVPAAELLPAWIHPGTGEPLARLAARLQAALPAESHPRRLALALDTGAWGRSPHG